ncbi:hypothetical protein KJY78_06280 [Canibacter sp. lx-45]|uniref:hypothetical protein n=1 Tax=Canibacter zhuwentaonis TaxID=2837491 RepID=UPI001BDC9FEC|nr:hypothetical protein [Canibacter zhuwentaonis]MBT1035950.1 hypothetical protein [Canibacter zhuwentaonis]
MIELHAEHLFTGEIWMTDVTVVGDRYIKYISSGKTRNAISFPLVLPGFVDAGANAEGYLETPVQNDTPFFPEEAFVGLCRAHGVTSVVDIGSSCNVGHWLISQEKLNVVSSLGRISSLPSLRYDFDVSADELLNLVAGLRKLGATFVTLGEISDFDITVLPCPVIRSHSRQGMVIPGFIVQHGASKWVCPQLAACSLWTVDGMLKASDASLGRAYLPHLKHFTGEGSFMFRRIARDILSKLYGDRKTDDLTDLSCAITKGDRDHNILASSGAGAAGIMPGAGLWTELKMLEQRIGFESALRTCTSNTGAAFPSLNAGFIKPEFRMDLLLCSERAGSISQLESELVAIVIGGVLSSIADEKEAVLNHCLIADGRSL